MATIINTLEVVVEPPAGATPPAPPRATSRPAPPVPISPTDVADLVERRGRYAARLLAH